MHAKQILGLAWLRVWLEMLKLKSYAIQVLQLVAHGRSQHVAATAINLMDENNPWPAPSEPTYLTYLHCRNMMRNAGLVFEKEVGNIQS
jgi:hypothetical protein